jgi:hypothetical protein
MQTPPPFTLELPFQQVLLLILGLFMFVGAFRGWFREFISSIVLLALFGVWFKPDLAAPIIDYIATVVRLIVAFIEGGGSLNLTQLAARAAKVTLPFDGDNPYGLLLGIMVFLVLLSYGTSGGGKGVSSLSRLLGGLFGLLNGYLVVSLGREFLVRYLRYSQPSLVTAAAPQQVYVSVLGLPTDSQLLYAAAALVGALAVVVFVTNFWGKPIGKK